MSRETKEIVIGDKSFTVYADVIDAGFVAVLERACEYYRERQLYKGDEVEIRSQFIYGAVIGAADSLLGMEEVDSAMTLGEEEALKQRNSGIRPEDNL